MLFLFTIPLIIYGEQNYLDAITKSAQLFIKQPFIIIIALLIAFIGMLLGIFCASESFLPFHIYILCTMPFMRKLLDLKKRHL